MNGTNRFLLDTNAIVALLRGEASIINLLQTPDWIGISVISYLEFLSFPELTKEDQSLFAQFSKRVEIVGIEFHQSRMIQMAIDLRKQTRLKLPDAIIASTALCENATLVTADRDFSTIDNLTILSF